MITKQNHTIQKKTEIGIQSSEIHISLTIEQNSNRKQMT